MQLNERTVTVGMCYLRTTQKQQQQQQQQQRMAYVIHHGELMRYSQVFSHARKHDAEGPDVPSRSTSGTKFHKLRTLTVFFAEAYDSHVVNAVRVTRKFASF